MSHEVRCRCVTSGRHAAMCSQSLSFARAACAARACAYKIQPGTRPQELRMPFVGPARAQQICDLATHGTTQELEQHRCGRAPAL